MRNVLAFFAATILTATAAAYTPPGGANYREYTAIDATSLGLSPSTGWLNVGGYNQLTLEVVWVDGNSSVTRLDMACLGAESDTTPTGSTTTYRPTNQSASGAVVTYTKTTPQITVAGSANLALDLALSYKWIKCTFTRGAGTASTADTLAIKPKAFLLRRF